MTPSIGPLIEELCEYAMTADAGVLLQPIEQHVERKYLLLIAADILPWLRSQASFGARRPLTVDPKYPRYQRLIEVVNADNEIGRWFTVRDDALDFADSVANEEREKARQIALEKFKTGVTGPRH